MSGQKRPAAAGATASPQADMAEAEVNAIRDPVLVEARREQLLDAARRLFIDKGYASTTIRDICAGSGVNQASLYDYVAGKHDILRRLLNRIWFRPGDAPTMKERIEAPDRPDLRGVLRSMIIDGWTSHREGILLAYRTVPHFSQEDRRALRAGEEQIIETLAAYLREQRGVAEDDRRAEIIANFIVYVQAFGPLRDWLMRDLDDALVLDTIVDGMMAMVDTLSQPPKADDRGDG